MNYKIGNFFPTVWGRESARPPRQDRIYKATSYLQLAGLQNSSESEGKKSESNVPEGCVIDNA